jgi:hypothetical protein
MTQPPFSWRNDSPVATEHEAANFLLYSGKTHRGNTNHSQGKLKTQKNQNTLVRIQGKPTQTIPSTYRESSIL